MPIQIDDYSSSLGLAISSTETTISVVSTQNFPALNTGDFTYATLQNQTTGEREIVKVNSINGNVLTVERGQHNTSAKAFPAGSLIGLRNDSRTLLKVIDSRTAGESGGLNAAQVDTRIDAEVKDYAKQGNSAKIPYSDLESVEELDSQGSGDVDDSDDLPFADRSDGNTIKRISLGQLKANITADLPTGGGGLDQSAVDARITTLRPNPFTTADETKLDGIEANAKDDQTAGEIKTALETLTGNDRLSATAIKDIPTGGGGGLDQSAVDSRITTLRPNAFTTTEKTKLAELEKTQDKAPDENLTTKNMVQQREVPRPVNWEYDNAAGEWQTAEFNANTIGANHVTCSVEYAPVGDSGTATNRGRYYLTFEGTTNALTGVFPDRTIAKMVVKLPSDNAFEVNLETDPDIAGGGTLRSTSVNPSNPTDLPNPSSNTPADVSGTIDFMFTDGTTAYENQWKQRSDTLLTETTVQGLIHAGVTQLRPIPFTESEQNKLQQLHNGEFDVSTVSVTPILEAGTLIADRRFGQTPKGTFGSDTGSAQHRLLEIALDSTGAAIALGGPRARFVGYQVQVGTTYIHLDSAYNVSEDNPNVTEYDLTGNYADLLNTATPTTVILLAPLTENNYLPNDGAEDQYATPNSDGDITWKDLPLALTGPHVLNLVDRQDVGVTITDAQADKLGIPTYLPLATLNLTNETGQFIVRDELRISASTITNLGFTSGSPGDLTVTLSESFSATELKATPQFVTGGTQEGIKKSYDIYSGTTKIGTIDRYITRAQNGQIGYYVSFDANSQGPASGTATVQNKLSITFIENDPGPTSGGGGGTTQTLNKSDYESTLAPSLASTAIALDGVVGVTLGDFDAGSHNTTQGLTRANNRITVARAGRYTISTSLNISVSTATAMNAGGARNYIDHILYIYRNNAKINVKSSRGTDYIRRPSNANANEAVGPADESFSITETLLLQANDAIGIDLIGKHLQSTTANPPVAVSVAVAASNSELRISNTEYTLS